MKAFLDDTAQIIGPRFDFDQKTEGRSERETYIARFVLDKAKTVYENGKKLGGVKYLPFMDANLMRMVYLKKYSKNEEGKEKAVTGKDEKKQSEFDEKQFKAGKLLCEYGSKLVEEDLVQGTWGNLSIRLDEEYMLVTPSGIDYNRLTPYDMVKVRIDDISYDREGLKPTSERGLHAAVYKMRPEVNAVIHTHSTYCSVFAACRQSLIIEDEEGRKIFGDKVAIADYGLPGTKKLAKATACAVGNNNGAIMSHHGMVALGENIEKAFENSVLLERCAKSYLDKR